MPKKKPPRIRNRKKVLDPHFRLTEDLYRKFHPEAFNGKKIGVDAVALPDMSVNRGKYAEPIDCVRGFLGWGVAAFYVEDIPGLGYHIGEPSFGKFSFRPIHVPTDDYSHSEVRAYENGVHISWNESDESLAFEIREMHLKWRHALLWKLRYPIKPQLET